MPKSIVNRQKSPKSERDRETDRQTDRRDDYNNPLVCAHRVSNKIQKKKSK